MAQGRAEEIRAEDWSGEIGERWLAHLDKFEGMIAPIGEALLRAANIAPGETVLDVGSGGGATTRALAKAAGPSGRVTGLDISPALSAAAAKRAADAGLANVSFITADASTARLEPDHDVIFSRFGVMFFDDPVAAFSNLRKGLKKSGRLIFACWAAPFENQWILEVIQVLARHIALPEREPRAPGPFAFAEKEYVEEILTRAGFGDISFETWLGEQYVGGGMNAKDAAAFVVNALSIGEVVKQQPEDVQGAILRDVEEAFLKFETPQGVALGGKAWFVSARPA